MRVMLLDDEKGVIASMEYLLQDYPSYEIVYTSTDPFEALEMVREKKPDVIFLDVQMPVMNGLDFAERVREFDENVLLVFLTAYDHYALDAFRVNSLDYLLKPVTRATLRRAINHIEIAVGKRQNKPELEDEPSAKSDESESDVPSDISPDTKQSDMLLGSRNDTYYLINYNDALYIEFDDRKVFVITENGRYRLKYTIAYWEEILAPKGWLRTHRAFLVNLNKIESIEKLSNSIYNVKMKGCAQDIPVSRSFLNKFKQELNI